MTGIFAACSTAPISQEPIETLSPELLWQQRLVQLQSIAAFAMKGRLAVQTPEDAWSASLQWAQKEQLYKMRIIAPLGQGTYELTGGNGKVTLLTAEDESYQADDPEALMQGTLGWTVPVTGMRYWIIGMPEPNARVDDMSLDELGRIQSMQQDGWSVKITRYKEYQQFQLPAKITMENEPLKVRIIIKDWVRVL